MSFCNSIRRSFIAAQIFYRRKPKGRSVSELRRQSVGNALTGVVKLADAKPFIDSFIASPNWNDKYSYTGSRAQWAQVVDVWQHRICLDTLTGLEFKEKNDKGEPLSLPLYVQIGDDVMPDWVHCSLASTDPTDKLCYGKLFPVAKKRGRDPASEGPGQRSADAPGGASFKKIASALTALAESRNPRISNTVQVVFESPTFSVTVPQDVLDTTKTLLAVVKEAQDMDAIDKLVFEELAEGESFRLKMTRHDMSGLTWFTRTRPTSLSFADWPTPSSVPERP